MPSTSRKLLVAAALLTFASAGSQTREASAQATTIVKPEFLFIVDTSGSMNASTSPPATNSCGFPATRINDAACVVRNVADGIGDATFGLETFALTCAAGTTCHYTAGTNDSCGSTNCAALTVPGYPNTFLGCDDSSQIQVPISDALTYELRTWGDGSFTSCTNPSGLTPPSMGGNELSSAYNPTNCNGAAVSSTPLAGALHVAWNYISNRIPGRTSPYVNFNNTGTFDPYMSCRPLNVILLTDGGETCTAAMNATGATNNAANIGCLSVDLNGNGTIENPIPNSDPNVALRGRFESNIDSNADGDCYDAGEQRAFRTRVYSIGFGVGCNNASIESIATGGGIGLHTVSCSATTRHGYYAQNESDIARAIESIVSSSALVEQCNGLDDNCNGQIDEDFAVGPRAVTCTAGLGACLRTGTTVCNTTHDGVSCSATAGTPGVENTTAACSDGIDNDCDGFIDCGDPNCATQQSCVSGCVPTAEVCDGRDNNCNGMVDEGAITRPCGSNVGTCTPGTETCQPQTFPGTGTANWGACTGTGPGVETCDGLDNNCNGVADEGLTQPCGVAVGDCRAGVRQCIGGTFSGACVGSVGPTSEVCDGHDNDCNGMTDDAIASPGACGASGVGVCTTGMIQCVNGMLTCVGGTMPGAETCNNLDDDCNGLTDDGIPSMACTPAGVTFPTTPPMGVCREGQTACVNGATVCNGAVVPGPEICNGLDDNCNGQIDEGLDGTPCGNSIGVCTPGTLQCQGGHSTCTGGVGPSPEVCNGLDDDCNGQTDEGNPGGGGACGNAMGECVPGVQICRNGTLVCDGGRTAQPEVCNGLDDDCNGQIDEGDPGGGATCGSSVGECRPGTLHCVAGHVSCVGGVGPHPEECNCLDDDCNGMTDDPSSSTTPLCGAGSVCAGSPYCQCLRPCEHTEFPCPIGRTCATVMNQDLCVGDPCANVTCDTATQNCQNGTCVSRCTGVTCTDPLICNPRTGRCVENGCRALENCLAGQICRDNQCIVDPCAGVSCAATEACYNGHCGPSCTTVTCPTGQTCTQGVCMGSNRCASVTCSGGQVCNPATGMCTRDLCTNRACGPDQVCDPTAGSCVDDPCAIVRCPTGQTCAGGDCHAPPVPPAPPRDRVISSGGGGLGCRVGTSPGSVPSNDWEVSALFALMTTVLVGRRRSRSRTGRSGR